MRAFLQFYCVQIAFFLCFSRFAEWRLMVPGAYVPERALDTLRDVMFAGLSAENTMYQTVKTAVYVYGALRKLSPGQLEQCYGASVAVLQGSCSNATEPLEKVYGTPRKNSKVPG